MVVISVYGYPSIPSVDRPEEILLPTGPTNRAVPSAVTIPFRGDGIVTVRFPVFPGLRGG